MDRIKEVRSCHPHLHLPPAQVQAARDRYCLTSHQNARSLVLYITGRVCDLQIHFTYVNLDTHTDFRSPWRLHSLIFSRK